MLVVRHRSVASLGLVSLLGLGFAIAALFAAAPTRASGEDEITQALKDPLRPERARELDLSRKPKDVIAFAGLKRGDKVADLMPGAGYYTILFSDIVGPNGKVFAVVPAEILKLGPRATDGVTALQPTHKNVALLTPSLNAFATPDKLDMVWTSWNYHDFHDPFMGPTDVTVANRAVFAALKPGGTYLVLDHQAAPGSGLRDTNTLHRIDVETVTREVEAAGFQLEATSRLLANPADPHTANVFDGSVRGHTDTFILKFRKPIG